MSSSPLSPLRYPGGKSKLVPFMKGVFRENGLAGAKYIEPYAGGASVGLSLLVENYVSEITINDLDRSLFAFWHSILNETERFCRKIERTKLSVPAWRIQRNIQKRKEDASLFELGFSTFFLNRTNVSGVLSGGVIGGLNQTGNYKIDARFDKKKLVKRIEKIADLRERITVTQQDALALINPDNDDTFMYLDPPYVVKAKKLYRNTYDEIDHRRIAESILGKKNTKWVLSYDRHELISELYGELENNTCWNLSYGTSNRSGTEDIYAHPELSFENSKTYLN